MARRRSRSRADSKADREFISEAEEVVERLRGDLADLVEQRAAGAEVAPDLINGMFRSAHSLKALAGMFGLDPVRQLAHRLEEILDALRLGRLPLDSSSTSLIEAAIALFARLLERVGDAEALAAIDGETRELSARIEAAGRATPPSDPALGRLDLDPSLLRALTEYEEHRLRENLRRGRNIALVEATFQILSFETGLSELSAAIREAGEVVSTLPSPGEAPESQIRFALLVATDLPLKALATRPMLANATVHAVHTAEGDPAPAAAAAAPDAPRQPAPPAASAPPESLKSISDTVRVDIRKLDELMNLVGELVIQRGAIGDLAGQLGAEVATARIGANLGKIHKALDRKLRELQSAVLDVRMVPLRQVFDKVSRVVRSLRRQLDKSVRLEVRGADTELDKLIVEELVDPLMHVVRNALDHAIEPEEVRRAAGKDLEGTIRLEAFQRGSHVVIVVADDGVGIDAAAVRRRAEELGVVKAGETLTERETLDLVFEPGVTTRSEITETSGRGVGMDVVRSNLTELGGIVDIESTPGRGTTISMTLPITLAIVQSLIVRVSGQRFAIPLNAVLETILVEPRDIQRSDDREIFDLRGEPLVLRRLAVDFDLAPGADDTRLYLVVVGLGDLRVGLLVDSLVGQQDTVIKPIQGPVPLVRGIAGATEVGDPDPILVLDVSALVEDALRRREAA